MSCYSLDLRERVVKMVLAGPTQAVVSSHFQVHVNTVKAWVKQFRTTGHLRPQTSHSASDWMVGRVTSRSTSPSRPVPK